MLSRLVNSSIIVIIFWLCYRETNGQNASILIPLNKTVTWKNKELYSGYINSTAQSTTQFEFENINPNITFIIFQVHSHLYNVTLFNNTYIYGSYVNGTNIGLYSPIKPNPYTFYVRNPNNVHLRLYIAVHGYQKEDPIPGGCNMEFNVPTSPYLRTIVEQDYVLVEGAAARYNDNKDCSKLSNSDFIEFYRLYLPENDINETVYFKGIKKMITYENIEKYGELVPLASTKWHMRRMLSAYRGTGVVLVAVTYDTNSVSVYVPIVTYACSPLHDNCQLYDDFLSRSLCAALMFIGLFICFFGHSFFKHQMFLMGLLSGALVTFICLSLISSLDRPGLLGVSLISGLSFGAIWLIFWWLYGIPVVAVCLTTLNMGFLVSSIFYIMAPDATELLMEDINFWSLFILIMLLTSIIMMTTTLLSNLLCCAVLGAYAVVFTLDCYLGTSLKYILVNTVRRAVVPDFNKASIKPPFELGDILLTLLLVILAMVGFLFQQYRSRGRPPFPPPPRSVGPIYPELPSYGAVDVVDPRDRLYSVGGRSTRFGSDIAHHTSISQTIRRGDSDRTPLLP